MKCKYCENDILQGDSLCPFCGAVISDNVIGNVLPKHDCIRTDKIQNGTLALTGAGGNPELSPYNRIVFMLLGVLLGFWGIQFLYARRFISFIAVLASFILSMIFRDSKIAPLEILVMFWSFIASFVISNDGRKRKMLWRAYRISSSSAR